MAGTTPAYRMNQSDGTPMHADDSGYLTNTPDSAGSLDSVPRSNQKVSQQSGCQHWDPVSPTQLMHNPDLCRCRTYQSSYKRRIFPGRLKFLRRTASSVSNEDGTNETCLSYHDSPLQFKDEILGHDLPLIKNVLDSKEIGRRDDRVLENNEMEVDESGNESLWSIDSVGNETKQTPDRRLRYRQYHPHLKRYNENCDYISHQSSEIDSSAGNQHSISLCHSQKEDISIKNDYLSSDRLRKLNRRTPPRESALSYESSQEPTLCSRPFSLKDSSQRQPCLIGQEKVDFLSLLGVESDHWIIVKNILNYLEPLDLTAVAVVSKIWNMVCKADADSYQRIQHYVDHKQRNKENWEILQVKKLESLHASNHPRTYLRQIQNVASGGESHIVNNPTSPPPSPSKKRFLQFYKAGQKLENGKMLAPCPRCSLPSQIDGVSNVGQCTHERCRYLFCCICHCESHGSSACPVSVSFPQTRKRPASIGSKESKRNLRRL